MLLILIALVYVVINVFVILRIRRWLHCCHSFFRSRWFQALYLVVYILLSSSLLTAFLLPASSFQITVKKLSNYWLGTFLYILLALLTAKIIASVMRLLRKMPRRGSAAHKKLCRIGGFSASLCVIVLSVYGAFHARDLKTQTYEVTIQKDAGGLESLRIGLIADLHLGYSVGIKDVEKVVERLNSENLDLVCLAGDIYDNDYDAIDNPVGISKLLSQIQSTYGTFACYGNHDVSERLLGGFSVPDQRNGLRDPRIDEMLTDAGITVLNDEVKLIDHSFYLVGRLDAKKTGVAGLKQKTIEEFTKTLDMDRPVIVMEHQPRNLDDSAAAGIDLELAGHTHEGQLFPGNLAINLFWKNPYGLYQDDGFHSVVTSGVGVWGPNMRVATDSEVVIVDVKFSK